MKIFIKYYLFLKNVHWKHWICVGLCSPLKFLLNVVLVWQYWLHLVIRHRSIHWLVISEKILSFEIRNSLNYLNKRIRGMLFLFIDCSLRVSGKRKLTWNGILGTQTLSREIILIEKLRKLSTSYFPCYESLFISTHDLYF